MPLINDFLTPTSCQLAIWDIVESLDELHEYTSLTTTLKEQLDIRKTATGKKGFLAVRLAFQSMGLPLADLSFTAHGEPKLSNAFCSLSHSQRYAVSAIGEMPIGVDIEVYREQIVNIAAKFVHPNEQSSIIAENQIAGLTRLWTAKEAIYKAMHHPGLAFASQIEVAPFSLSDVSGSAQVHLAGKTHYFSLQFNTFNQHELTLAQLTSTL